MVSSKTLRSRDCGEHGGLLTGSSLTDLVEGLLVHLRGRRVLVLSGAGISTESGIPDYRGNGVSKRTPIHYRPFVSDHNTRRRYWARSAVGWNRVAAAEPNGAHCAVAALEAEKAVTGVITQNVDGLHQKAGSERVVELHGSLARVRCLACHHGVSRASWQDRLLALNPSVGDAGATHAPDGDADVDDDKIRQFVVPSCQVCDGVMKPDVVFFGENVPKKRLEEAWQLYDQADTVLVLGSSLIVFSGYRFVHRAERDARPVIIINDGETRGDAAAVYKVRGRLGSVMPILADRMLGREHSSARAHRKVC